MPEKSIRLALGKESWRDELCGLHCRRRSGKGHDLRFDELRKVLEGYGYTMKAPRGESSHYTFRKPGCMLITIPKYRIPKPPRPAGIPTPELLDEWLRPNWCLLDFEKLAQRYDAIELINAGAFLSSLNLWDCNCILVMNPNAVQVL